MESLVLFVGHARATRHIRAVMDIHCDNVSDMDINLPVCTGDRRKNLGRDTIGLAG